MAIRGFQRSLEQELEIVASCLLQMQGPDQGSSARALCALSLLCVSRRILSPLSLCRLISLIIYNCVFLQVVTALVSSYITFGKNRVIVSPNKCKAWKVASTGKEAS